MVSTMDPVQTLPFAAADDAAAWRASLHARQHAMRQPLNAIGLLCEALHLQGPDAASAPILQGLRGAVASLERHIDEHFLDLERPDAFGHVTRPRSPPPVQTNARPMAVSGREVAQGRQVVVVDDDAAARVGLVLLLEAWGVEARALPSVAAVRGWLAERPPRPPDLVILDYHLPRPGEGLEALRLMRAAWPAQLLRALLITGDDRAALSNALFDGSIECLIKPVMPAPLLQAIQRQWAAPRPSL